MNRLVRRIDKWESLFAKYENTDSNDVFSIRTNSWEPVQEGDKCQEFSKDVKETIDGLWKRDTHNYVRHLLRTTTDADTQKKISTEDCKPYSSGINEETTSEESFSSDDDDDYESYESDPHTEDVEDGKFYSPLCHTPTSRIKALQRTRRKSPCIFDQRGAERTSHKTGKRETASAPTSPRDCLKNLQDRTSSSGDVCPTKPDTQERCSDLKKNLSTKENESYDNSRTSNEPSFSKQLSSLKINSPLLKQKESNRLSQMVHYVRGTPRCRESNKTTTDEMNTTPVMRPVGDRKRKILSPRENCQRSPEVLMKHCKVVLIRPKDGVLTTDLEGKRKVLTTQPESFTDKSSHNMSSLSLSTPPSSINRTARISLDSADLRKKGSSERRAYRALMKGCSFLDI